ncbi:MAG TPA: hypothetical protein VN081_01655 [Dongiaceae bacterium]|nr:hypothetical protein [Dongiaceae bacterium]
MNGFTSGYRAAHGLPSARYARRHADDSEVERDLTGAEWRDAGLPEYDVPDNPILAEFRQLVSATSYDRLSLIDHKLSELRWEERHYHYNWSRDQMEHARRVLSKLVAVYA